ncbi:MAG TPA: hypothetical protein VMH86_07595 [Rhizomicrobium sp.]|nr:hypothetical protein [Rhizomicrobium sp.]
MPRAITPRHNRPHTGELHPAIWRAIAGCVLFWVAASVVFFMGAPGHGLSTLGVVAAFAAICLLVTNRLGAIQRAHPIAGRPGPQRMPLADWLSGDFDIWQGRMHGWEAAITLLTPILAGVAGAAAFVIVFHVMSPPR